MNLHRCAAADARDFPLGIASFRYSDLYDPRRLKALAETFDQTLKAVDPETFQALLAGRRGELPEGERSKVLLKTAPHLSRFLARLFGIDCELEAQSAQLKDEFAYFAYVKRAMRFSAEDPGGWDMDALAKKLAALVRTAFPNPGDPEQAFAGLAVFLDRLAKDQTEAALAEITAFKQRLVADAEASRCLAAELAEPEPHAFLRALLDLVERWTYAAAQDPVRFGVEHWAAFKKPKRIDYDRLVECELETRAGVSVLAGPKELRRRRDGFALTDPRASLREANFEIDRCVLCHERDSDACSKGQRAKEG
ncbi:MAG: hypothetical protein ACK4JF_10025, partial [Methylohalobius sp.]